MIRFYLRLILVPILLLTAALLLIRTQPYDDHGLRKLLLPDNCPAPCFMGIRPGVTTIDEAAKLLETSHWIEIDPTKLNIGINNFPISFKWNGNQSDLIDASQSLTLVFQNTKPKKVAQISLRVQPDITLGDLYLSLGKPSGFSRPSIMSPNTGPNQYILLVVHQYDAYLMNIFTISGCPLSLTQLLNQTMFEVQYSNMLRTDYAQSTLKDVLRYPNCG